MLRSSAARCPSTSRSARCSSSAALMRSTVGCSKRDFIDVIEPPPCRGCLLPARGRERPACGRSDKRLLGQYRSDDHCRPYRDRSGLARANLRGFPSSFRGYMTQTADAAFSEVNASCRIDLRLRRPGPSAILRDFLTSSSQRAAKTARPRRSRRLVYASEGQSQAGRDGILQLSARWGDGAFPLSWAGTFSTPRIPDERGVNRELPVDSSAGTPPPSPKLRLAR